MREARDLHRNWTKTKHDFYRSFAKIIAILPAFLFKTPITEPPHFRRNLPDHVVEKFLHPYQDESLTTWNYRSPGIIF